MFAFTAVKRAPTNQELDNRLDDLPERVETTLHFNSTPHPPPVQEKEKASSRMEVSSPPEPPKPLENSPLLPPPSRRVASYATVASNVPPASETVAPMGVDSTAAVKAVNRHVKIVVVPNKAVASEHVTPVTRKPVVEQSASFEWSTARHTRRARHSEPIMSIEEHNNRFVSDELPMEVESQEVESDGGESRSSRKAIRTKKVKKTKPALKSAPLARESNENIPKDDNEFDIGGYFKSLSPTDIYSKLRGQLDPRDCKTQDKQKAKRVRRMPAERSRRRFMLHFSQLAESDYDTFTALDAKDLLKMRSVGGLKYPVPPFNNKEKPSSQPNEVNCSCSAVTDVLELPNVLFYTYRVLVWC